MAIGLKRRPLTQGSTAHPLFQSPGDTSDGGPMAQVGEGGVPIGQDTKPDAGQGSQGSETPRERAKLPTSTTPGAGRRQGGIPTPTQSKEPSPVAAESANPQSYMGGSPLGGVNSPGGGGLMGSAEGLLGGGLGVMGSGAPQTDILTTLLELLGQMPGR